MNLIRKDILLSPVNEDLLRVVVDDGWFHDSETNWRLGFGRDLVGRKVAVETFYGFLNTPPGENRGMVGVYKRGEPVGFIHVSYLGESSKTAAVFLFLAPAVRGTPGVATSALLLCLDRLFREKGIFRIQTELLTINRNGIQFLRKMGFTQEGVRRSAHWMGVNSFDAAPMRLLKPAWKKAESEVQHAA